MFESSASFRRFQPSKNTSKSIPIQSMLFAMIVFDVFMGIAGATAVPPDQLTSGSDTSVSAGGDHFTAKRNWQSLQGAWGKRSLDAGISAELSNTDDDVYFAERRVPLPFHIDGVDSPNPVLKYSLVFLRKENGANILDRLINAEDETLFDSHPNEMNNQKAVQYDAESIDANEGMDDTLDSDKRAWKSINVGWGKRRSAPQWNKFKGAWGKREPGWNNLKGMWGKRSSKDWQKLHGSWGKRSFDTN